MNKSRFSISYKSLESRKLEKLAKKIRYVDKIFLKKNGNIDLKKIKKLIDSY